MRHVLLFLLTFRMCLAAVAVADDVPAPVFYFPDGDDIVCVNGTNRYTRALYGGHTAYRLETGDRPLFAVYSKEGCRNIRFLVTACGQTTALEDAGRCEARYGGGTRRYTLGHEAWGGGEITVTAMAKADTSLFVFRASGFDGEVMITAVTSPVKAARLHRNGDIGVDAPDSFDPSPPTADDDSTTTVVGDAPVYIIHTLRDGICRIPYADTVRHDDGQPAFHTPCAWLNPVAGALNTAADALWDGRTWLHGCVGWRTPLPGWRAAYVGDVLGQGDRQRSHFDAYAASQIKDVEPVIAHPSQDTLAHLARAEKRLGTQMYSNGYICRDPGSTGRLHHYDMNIAYVDALLRHFDYDADTAYMRRMWPVITSHLAWEKRNYDPDDDALYDAYCCIWASDALYYGGGAVTHSSAYNYKANGTAARMARLIGEDPEPYAREAGRILDAMNRRLWTDDAASPHWAEYIEGTGYGRRHDDAALWSVYTPIDCGAGTAEQSYQATRYVDGHIPRLPVDIPAEYDAGGLPSPLFTLSTTDWQPYSWSINNAAHAEVMHTALAYFLAGRPAEGYRLLLSDIIDGMYLGSSPGNFGQISRLDAMRGECYRDFGDCIGIASRAIYQGLFGIMPDALDGRCVIRPGFPAAWDSVTVSLPYISYTFSRRDGHDIYEITQNFAQPLRIVLRQNTGGGRFRDIVGTAERHQTVMVETVAVDEDEAWSGAGGGDATAVPACFPADSLADGRPVMTPIDIDDVLNARVTDIFRNEYRSPRPQTTTLQIPLHGAGDWCHPDYRPEICDTGLKAMIVGDCVTLCGIPFRMHADGRDIAFTSLWDNYPDSIVIDLTTAGDGLAADRLPGREGSDDEPSDGPATRRSGLCFLIAGSTNHMQSRIDNALITVRYDDGTGDTLHLRNPDNLWPIDRDCYVDDRAFAVIPGCDAADYRDNMAPVRVSLATGLTGRCLAARLGHSSPDDMTIPGGAAGIITMKLRDGGTPADITIKALSPDVVIGVMAVTHVK